MAATPNPSNSKRLTRRSSAATYFPTTALRRGILGVFAHAPATDDSLLKAFMLGSARTSPFDCVRRAHGVTRADLRRGRSLHRTTGPEKARKPTARSADRARSLSRSSDSDDGISIEESLGRVGEGMSAAKPRQGKPLGTSRRSAAPRTPVKPSHDLLSAATAAAAVAASITPPATMITTAPCPAHSADGKLPSPSASSPASTPQGADLDEGASASGFLRELDSFPTSLCAERHDGSGIESFHTAAGKEGDVSGLWHLDEER